MALSWQVHLIAYGRWALLRSQVMQAGMAFVSMLAPKEGISSVLRPNSQWLA
jgi:hypothetical protein